MEVRVFVSDLINHSLDEGETKKLVRLFKEYKETGVAPDEFGRDVPTKRPDSAQKAELQHMHLKQGNWRRVRGMRLVQFYKRSDKALVYCPGFFNPNCYLLIAIFTDAHRKQNNTSFMGELADIAERFRSRF